MKFKMCLWWALSGDQGDQICPNWERIESLLHRIGSKSVSGTISLKVDDGPEIGPDLLQVRAQGGNYLVTLGILTADDYDVRSSKNKNARPGVTSILGEVWNNRVVITDINVVREAFKQFFESGDVSQELLR